MPLLHTLWSPEQNPMKTAACPLWIIRSAQHWLPQRGQAPGSDAWHCLCKASPQGTTGSHCPCTPKKGAGLWGMGTALEIAPAKLTTPTKGEGDSPYPAHMAASAPAELPMTIHWPGSGREDVWSQSWAAMRSCTAFSTAPCFSSAGMEHPNPFPFMVNR